MKKNTKRNAETPPVTTWTLRGRTYVAHTATGSRGLGVLDKERAESMTDEGGPAEHPIAKEGASA